MAELKTKATAASVTDFLNAVPDEKHRKDSLVILDLMKEATGMSPKMWGESIIGFGSEHYKYASGREGDTPIVGFSPRKANLVLYLMVGFEKQTDLMDRLGKHKIGKVCLYINKIEDINLSVLRSLIQWSVDQKRKPAE